MVIVQPLPKASPRRYVGCLDRGAAAVEMALILPVLLFLMMGMIDFGRAYNAQIQLSQAAREGVRLASLNTSANSADVNNGSSAIATRVSNAAGGLSSFTAGCSGSNKACITYCPVPYGAGDNATVVLTSDFTWITGISAISKFFGPGSFPTPATLQSTGVMRCAG